VLAGRLQPHRPGAGGFSLLELIVAVVLLTAIILNVLHLLAEAKVRSLRTTQLRRVRDLAQKKLHERVHYFVEEDEGTFEEEGEPAWRWEVPPPVPQGQSEQVLLEYSIRVTVPFALEGAGSSSAASASSEASKASERSSVSTSESGGSVYEYSVWVFPDERWYEEQDYLYSTGQPSLLYGDPDLGTGGLLPASGLPGAGSY
jgi:Tfp pilus assembly protein PilV